MTTSLAAAGEGFVAPGPQDFEFPSIGLGITKPLLELAFALVLIMGFFWVALRRPAVVPGKLQFVGESLYGFIRNSVARDSIGSKDFRGYVAFLFTLFTFILVNNLFGIVPLIQFPTMSKAGIPYLYAGIVWFAYIYIGFRRHGFAGFMRLMTWPPNVPWWIRILLTPIEFVSNFLVRPVTLSLRLFANMFAGHLLLLVFVLGGEYMLLHSGVLLPKLLSPFAFGMGIVMTGFEALVQVLQAYIFTLLAAVYFGSSLVDEH